MCRIGDECRKIYAVLKLLAQPTQEDWGEILRIADPKEWNALGEDASLNALSEFQTAAASCIVGRLALDYPNSTHGDGSAVDVFRLPSGTIVITRFDTFESESPNAEVFQSDSIDEMSEKAKDLLVADEYGENIQKLNEFPD